MRAVVLRWALRVFWASLAAAAVAKVAVDSGAPRPLLAAALWSAAVAALAGVLLQRRDDSSPSWLDRWRLPLVLLALASVPLVYPRLGGDGFQYFLLTRSPILDHDLDFAEDLQRIGSGPRLSVAPGVVRGYPFGLPLLWAPPFVVAHVGTLLARALGAEPAADGFSPPYASAVLLASFAYGILALVLIEAELRRRYGPALALLTVLGLWLATPLDFYMSANPFMSHAASAFAASVFVVAWLRARARGGERAWLLAGCAGALLFLVRVQDAVLLAGPALDLLVREREKRVRRFAAFMLPGFALALLQAAAWFSMYGADFAGDIAGQAYIGRTAPHVLDLLFAARHGLFTWTPLYLLAVLGLVAWLRRDAWLASAFLLSFALSVAVNSAMQDWWGSDSFGQRRLLGLTPFFGFGLAEAFLWLKRRPLVPLVTLVLALAAWNAQLAAIYNGRLAGRASDALSLDQVSRAQFELAHRRLLRWEAFVPGSVFVLLYDNLRGVWLDERPLSLGGRIDLGAETDDVPGLVGEGWSDPRNDGDVSFRRILGPRALLRVPIRTPGAFVVAVRARSRTAAAPASLGLEVNGSPLGNIALGADWAPARLVVPERILRPGLNSVALVAAADLRADVDALTWDRQLTGRGPR